MTNSIPAPVQPSSAGGLRAMMGMWAVAAFLPLPILVATDPANSADVSCLYLGVINAWLVTEFHRAWGLPGSATSWRAMMRVISTAISVNVALFVGFGLAAGVQTHFPFPLMAVLSALPVVGVMPWMLRRVPQHPYAAIVFSGFLIFACKLAGCVVARLVYGPDYLAQGYAAADWRTAKLMITLLWSFSTLLSLGLLLAEYRYCARKNHDQVA
ncbi:MAG: hypothetical protein V9H26_00460 [Verrucomicrobiota bacterium]|nr:hypothetical protein [Limisphaerales bacterium]